MKTTNKILLTTLFLILAGISITLIYFRVQLSRHPIQIMGSGDVITEERQLGLFDAVSVNGKFNVELHISDSNKLIINAYEDLMEYINTDINNNTLVIDFQLKTGRYKKIEIDVYVNSINSLEVSSGASINSTDTVYAFSFNHLVSSGAQSSLILNVDDLHLESSSGSRAVIMGLARTVRAKTNSGAQIRAAELSADVCHIDASSGANAQVTANNELHVNASSGSNVRYGGNPAVQNISTSGGASVKPL